MDLDVERLVVDLDAAIPAVGDPGDVGDHLRLEVAGRGLHRRLLGLLDLAQRELVDPSPAMERRQLLAPRREPLGVGGDRLGVDGVRLDPRPGVCLLVTGALQGRVEVADLDLEALPGPRLVGDRSEGLERVGLLLDLEGGVVAEPRQRLERLLVRRARRAGR